MPRCAREEDREGSVKVVVNDANASGTSLVAVPGPRCGGGTGSGTGGAGKTVSVLSFEAPVKIGAQCGITRLANHMIVFREIGYFTDFVICNVQ